MATRRAASILSFALALSACTAPAPSAPDGPPFPRIASYRIETSIDAGAEAMLDKVPLAIVDAEAGALEPAALARIRAANPHLALLAYLTSEEIPRAPDATAQPLAAARFAKIPSAYWLTEPGSRTLDAIDAHATEIRVRDPAAFSVTRPRSAFYGPDEPTYLLVGDESVRLTAIHGDTLVVERGPGATAHPAGARIAAHVVFFAGTWMLDLASTAPADAHGRRWRDLLADQAAALVARGPWNGVFLDVCFEDIGFLGPVDEDRDGRADPPAAASAAWRAGFGALVAALRARLPPHVPIVANPGAQDCPQPQLDGILLEGFPTGLPPSFLAFSTGLARYRRWSAHAPHLTIVNGYSPRIGFHTIAPGQDAVARDDYAAMRLGLAVALMGDGYYSYDNGVFGHYVSWWYDEYDGAGRGPGWLGEPVGPPEHRDGAWLRAFTHGLAIANPTAAPVAVAVPPGYRKLAGGQDPQHNDGRPVAGTLVVAPHDGYVLARD